MFPFHQPLVDQIMDLCELLNVSCDKEKRKIQTPALSSRKKKIIVHEKRHEPLIREETRYFLHKIN